jgi:hypothetical protein
MAINFPDTPTQGDTYVSGDITWEYDGTKWKKLSTATLGNLTDINTTGVQDGQTLIYNSATQKWEPGAGGEGGSVSYAIALGG